MLKEFLPEFPQNSLINFKYIHSSYNLESKMDVSILQSEDIQSGYKTKLSQYEDLSAELNICDLGIAKNGYFSPLVKNIVEINNEKNAIIVEFTTQTQLSESDKQTKLVFSSNPKVKNNHNTTLAACQRHYGGFEKINNQIIGLGQIRENIQFLEPVIRKSEFLSFSMDAVKRAETQSDYSPICGLTILETCKIARYAGFSDSLKHIQIVLPVEQSDCIDEISALFIWYFLEARSEFVKLNKKPDYIQNYIVHCESLDVDLSFIKDIQKDKWWVLNPFEEDEKLPCNESDYLKILNGEDPIEFLSIFEAV